MLPTGAAEHGAGAPLSALEEGVHGSNVVAERVTHGLSIVACILCLGHMCMHLAPYAVRIKKRRLIWL